MRRWSDVADIAEQLSDDGGVHVDRDIWRKREVISLNSPFVVAAEGAGLIYSMDFCSEYLEAGQVKAKGEAFGQLAEELFSYSKKWLR